MAATNIAVAASSSGSNTIVAAVSGRRIRVLHYTIVPDAAVTVQWLSAATALSGIMSLAAKAPLISPFATRDEFQVPAIFETASGEALNLSLGGSVGVNGHLVYELVS